MPTIFRQRVDVSYSSAPTSIQVSFNNLALKPAQALEWGCDIFDGWYDTSDLNVILTNLVGSDGAIAGDFFASNARNLTLSGYVQTKNTSDLEAMQDIIVGSAFPRNTELFLTRYDSTPKFVRALRAGKLEITKTSPNFFRWSVPLVAPDPLKYALTPFQASMGVAGLSSSGFSFPLTMPLIFTALPGSSDNSMVVVNNGTGPTPPIVTLYGPLNRGWTLANITTGDSLGFDVGLSVGDVMNVDFRQGIAVLNGSVVTATVIGDFWRIVKGVNIVKLFANYDPLAGFTLTSYSAWE